MSPAKKAVPNLKNINPRRSLRKKAGLGLEIEVVIQIPKAALRQNVVGLDQKTETLVITTTIRIGMTDPDPETGVEIRTIKLRPGAETLTQIIKMEEKLADLGKEVVEMVEMVAEMVPKIEMIDAAEAEIDLVVIL